MPKSKAADWQKEEVRFQARTLLLADFGRSVLRTMEDHDEWNSDTLAQLCELAFRLDLVRMHKGRFTIKKKFR